MPTISVAGTSTYRAPAELGTLHLTVSATGDAPAPVVELVAARHAELTRDAAAFAASGAAASWTSQSVSSGAVWEWQQRPDGNGEQVRRFQAGADVTVTFTDLTALQEWALAVAALENVQVDGIEWDLTPDHRSRATGTTRTEATRDAVARAATFAEAAGLGQPRLVSLYEEGLRGGGGDGGPQPFPKVARAHLAADSGGGAVELHPREIEIVTSVTADFEADRA